MPSSDKQKSLFNPEEEITFYVFLKNFVKFVSTNVTDVVPLFFSYCMFNVAGETDKTPIAGLAVSCFMFYFAFSMDFFEVENTIAAPYFSKKNYKLFTIRTFRVAIINFVFFLLSCGLVFVNKPLLQLFELKSDEIADTSFFLTYYVPFVGTFFTITNFLRGGDTQIFTKPFQPLYNFKVSCRVSTCTTFSGESAGLRWGSRWFPCTC